jgi:hypothetical protein
MNPYPKLIMTLISIGVTVIVGFAIENKRKRILVIMLILLVISMASNRSIYWILYWDGPHYGKVVDADTGEPIVGASVAGIWEFEYLHIKSSVGFANAKETVTNKDGKFTIPLAFAFTFWPFSVLEEMAIVVFKPGYDSHPPVIRRKMQKPENAPVIPTDGKYHVGDFVHCKAWRECEIRLNKAINIKEAISAHTECQSRLSAMKVNQRKVRKFLEVIDKSKFKYLEKKN